MNDNPFDGEIYVKSRCIAQENTVARLLEDFLLNLGYIQQSTRTWIRENQQVVVCLVDDFNIFKNDLSDEQHYNNAVILTENYVSKHTDYRVLQLPTSFYSTFSYTPALLDWAPHRDFHLFINRCDDQRLAIFNEFCRLRGLSESDYVAMKAFSTPYKNYALTIEQACVQSYLNLIVETYASDSIVALSEKTFRALQTPAPWVLYGCKESVAYLKNIGFDVLDDVVDHSVYDNLNNSDKIVKWISLAINALEDIKQEDCNKLKKRCQTAASHNQQLLSTWKKAWPTEFSAWLADTLKVLNS